MNISFALSHIGTFAARHMPQPMARRDAPRQDRPPHHAGREPNAQLGAVWHLDPATGRPACRWVPGPESRHTPVARPRQETRKEKRSGSH